MSLPSGHSGTRPDATLTRTAQSTTMEDATSRGPMSLSMATASPSPMTSTTTSATSIAWKRRESCVWPPPLKRKALTTQHEVLRWKETQAETGGNTTMLSSDYNHVNLMLKFQIGFFVLFC